MAQPKASRVARPARGREADAQSLQAKWGPELVATGWVALPTIILEKQSALGLDAMDVNIIMHIAKHWFERDNLPFPSKGSIAAAMQVTPRAVQKRIAGLEALGFLKRIERRSSRGSQTSQFDLTGLIEQATPFAIEAKQERDRINEQKRNRLRRKKPELEEP
jgi:DNA replication protein DnaD